MNGRQKSTDEPNTKLLREMTNLPANKYCFDCGQRGPTYVNVTIGSFVCMSCSGLLRGLTPPHRVKSISMATFTPDEIELLKNRGNEYCRRVWLATCSAKDSHIGSERDPDRMNMLRNFMSSKYEQKRFYVDPSRLPRGELAEIQAQTARALSLMATSKSGSLNSGSSTQKSPSLSSTRSSSSLHSNPSPSLSNGRRSADIASQQGFGFGPHRLVNSVTLPDIKPLSALMGPSVPSIVASGNQNDLSALSANPNAIDFISNLSSTTNQSSFASLKSSSSQQRNFLQQDIDNQQNFANFEDAFKNNEFAFPSPAAVSGNPGFVASFDNTANSFAAFGQSSSPAFSQLNNPLVPTNNHVPNSSHATIPKATSSAGPSEDKYAALKDLDSLFKQTSNDGSTSNGFAVGSPANNTGISSSLSVPANLSNSAGSAGWFSTSPVQNPFSQVSAQAQDPQVNGWANQSALGIIENGSSPGVNITNPFASETSNGWKNAPPTTSPNQRFCAPISSHGFGTNFGQSNGISSFTDRNTGTIPTTFNPFFGTGSKANQHNPFL